MPLLFLLHMRMIVWHLFPLGALEISFQLTGIVKDKSIAIPSSRHVQRGQQQSGIRALFITGDDIASEILYRDNTAYILPSLFFSRGLANIVVSIWMSYFSIATRKHHSVIRTRQNRNEF